MRWYYPPQYPQADLSRGFETFDKLDDAGVDEHLDSLLVSVVAHEQKTQTKIDAQVLTWRGMMTKVSLAVHVACVYREFANNQIMAAPYDDRDG